MYQRTWLKCTTLRRRTRYVQILTSHLSLSDLFIIQDHAPHIVHSVYYIYIQYLKYPTRLTSDYTNTLDLSG